MIEGQAAPRLGPRRGLRTVAEEVAESQRHRQPTHGLVWEGAQGDAAAPGGRARIPVKQLDGSRVKPPFRLSCDRGTKSRTPVKLLLGLLPVGA